jgi:hypothetical protein
MKTVIRSFICIGLLLSVWNAKGQVWNTVGTGLQHKHYNFEGISTTDDNNLYVMHGYLVNPTIEKWNGLFWTSISAPKIVNPVSIEVLQGNIYVVCYFPILTDTLYEYNGTNW